MDNEDQSTDVGADAPITTDDRKAAYAARDEAKAAARAAAAERDAARAALAEITEERNAIVSSKVDAAIAECCDPAHHKAAAVILAAAGIGVKTTAAEIRELLREHGLVTTRTAGSPGVPGVNMATKKPGEAPPTLDEMRARVRGIAESMSRHPNGPPMDREYRENLARRNVETKTMTVEGVRAIAARLNADEARRLDQAAAATHARNADIQNQARLKREGK